MGAAEISGKALTLSQAARELGLSPATMRRMVQRGAPVVSTGGPGRGKGARVDLEAIRRWRGMPASHEDLAVAIAPLALDFHRRGQEPGFAGQRVLGIPNAHAAALLVFFIDYIADRTKREVRSPERDLLEAIARNFQNRSAVRVLG
jgi:hypothetical protein